MKCQIDCSPRSQHPWFFYSWYKLSKFMFKSMSSNLNIHHSFFQIWWHFSCSCHKVLVNFFDTRYLFWLNICTNFSLKIAILTHVSIKNLTSSSSTVLVAYTPSLSSRQPISKALGLLVLIELKHLSSTNSRFPTYVHYLFFIFCMRTLHWAWWYFTFAKFYCQVSKALSYLLQIIN